MTSISKLNVGGFKSIRDRTEIPIAPITFLFGPNSAGKSTVLEVVRALSQRIEEPWEPESNIDKPPRVYAQGNTHRVTGISSGTEDSVSTVLGVEVEDFATITPEFGSDPSEGQLDGQALAWAIDGAAVLVQIEEYYFDRDGWPFRGSESTVSIDQIPLFRFLTPLQSATTGLFTDLETTDKTDESAYMRWKNLGCVMVNHRHPLWDVKSIKETSANFDRLPGFAESSDSARNHLSKMVEMLVTETKRTAMTPLRQLYGVEGEWLWIRTTVDFLKCKPWSASVFVTDSFQENEIFDVWKRLGLNVDNADEDGERNSRTTWEISNFLVAVNAFGASVLNSLSMCLRVSAVDGDRGVLTRKDVKSEFPDFMAHALTDGSWDRGWEVARPTEGGGAGTKREFFSLTDLYAWWLAAINVEARFVGEEIQAKLRLREDFVNAMLMKGVFGSGARRYEVKPEVWSKTSSLILGRDPNFDINDAESDSYMEVQLYLQDQNERRMDFSDVGSGISYIFPILVALMCARTSWIAQPELHLHPSAQCEMGDVFLRAFNRGHGSIVETHSEHILLRVLKRIRQATKGTAIDDDLKCPPEAVCVLYFDPQDDGSTQIRQLRVTRLGDFKDRWPDGFFEERGKELFDE